MQRPDRSAVPARPSDSSTTIRSPSPAIHAIFPQHSPPPDAVLPSHNGAVTQIAARSPSQLPPPRRTASTQGCEGAHKMSPGSRCAALGIAHQPLAGPAATPGEIAMPLHPSAADRAAGASPHQAVVHPAPPRSRPDNVPPATAPLPVARQLARPRAIPIAPQQAGKVRLRQLEHVSGASHWPAAVIRRPISGTVRRNSRIMDTMADLAPLPAPPCTSPQLARHPQQRRAPAEAPPAASSAFRALPRESPADRPPGRRGSPPPVPQNPLDFRPARVAMSVSYTARCPNSRRTPQAWSAVTERHVVQTVSLLGAGRPSRPRRPGGRSGRRLSPSPPGPIATDRCCCWPTRQPG